MIANVVRGGRMQGLMVYLASDGDAHEVHVNPRIVAGDESVLGAFAGAELDHDTALAVGAFLDRPRADRGIEIRVTKAVTDRETGERTETLKAAHVWHTVLALEASEGEQSDAWWNDFVTEFMERMGFGETADGAGDGARWVAVRHGLSAGGNDHVHIAASAVRRNGLKVDLFRDWTRAHDVKNELCAARGMDVVMTARQGRAGDRGWTQGEQAAALARGMSETDRQVLGTRLRAAAAAARSEAEFVALVTADGVLVRPRFADGTRDVVTGYSVALRPEPGARPVWFAGGTVARDLTLPRLRSRWADTPESATVAAEAWRTVREGLRNDTGELGARPESRTPAMREELARRVEDAAARTGSEAEFVRALRAEGVLVRPRFVKGSRDHVAGYSVALRPETAGARPVWFAGGKVARGLALSALRERWGESAEDRAAATAVWREKNPGPVPVVPGVPAGVRESVSAESAARMMRVFADELARIEPQDVAAWATVAREAGGVAAAFARRLEPGGGPITDAARALSASAQTAAWVERQGSAVRVPSLGMLTAAVLLAGSEDPMVGWTVVVGEMMRTLEAIAEAKAAREDLSRATAMRDHARALGPVASGGGVGVVDAPTVAATASPVTAPPPRRVVSAFDLVDELLDGLEASGEQTASPGRVASPRADMDAWGDDVGDVREALAAQREDGADLGGPPGAAEYRWGVDDDHELE